MNDLQSVYERYLLPAGIPNCQFFSDDGSENYGPVKAFIESCQYPSLQHLVAQKDVEFSNSMIEAANNIITIYLIMMRLLNMLCRRWRITITGLIMY